MIELGKKYRIKKVGIRYQAQLHWNSVWIDLEQNAFTLLVSKKIIDKHMEQELTVRKVEYIDYPK